jgi:hypothetical protein
MRREAGAGKAALARIMLLALLAVAGAVASGVSAAPAMAQQAGAAGVQVGSATEEDGLLHEIQAGRDGPSDDDAGGEEQTERKCGRGRYLSKGHCCARGTSWNGQRCLRRPALLPICPRGTSGTYPDCQARREQVCPSGTAGRWPNCQSTQVCPSGTVGAPPNCRAIRGRSGPIARACPAGTVGVPPVCRRIGPAGCPAGTVGSGGRCLVLQPMRPVPTIRSPAATSPPRTRAPMIGSGANTRPLWR